METCLAETSDMFFFSLTLGAWFKKYETHVLVQQKGKRFLSLGGGEGERMGWGKGKRKRKGEGLKKR